MWCRAHALDGQAIHCISRGDALAGMNSRMQSGETNSQVTPSPARETPRGSRRVLGVQQGLFCQGGLMLSLYSLMEPGKGCYPLEAGLRHGRWGQCGFPAL
jgi:hypothetical protein